VPLVVRLSGTEAEAGRKLLQNAPARIRATMNEAGEAVRLAKEPAASERLLGKGHSVIVQGLRAARAVSTPRA